MFSPVSGLSIIQDITMVTAALWISLPSNKSDSVSVRGRQRRVRCDTLRLCEMCPVTLESVAKVGEP